jgi:hypothetical protein
MPILRISRWSCGYLLPADLPAAQAQISVRSMRPIGTTGKSVKPVQPLRKKYSASRTTQITPITPRISSTQGALATSRTRGEMRWTRRAQADVGAFSGRRSRVVLAPRCWRKALRVNSRSDGGKKAVHRGEHEVSRNLSRRESRDASAALYARVRDLMRKLHTRSRVQRAPGFPCALGFREGESDAKLGASQRRERGRMPSRCLTVESGR